MKVENRKRIERKLNGGKKKTRKFIAKIPKGKGR